MSGYNQGLLSSSFFFLLFMENTREDMYNDGLEAICAIILFPFVTLFQFTHDDRLALLHMSWRFGGFCMGCLFVTALIFLWI